MAKSKTIEDMLNTFLEEMGHPSRSSGLCVMCGGARGTFRDEISEREWDISKMCQSCQDKFFDPND